MTDQMQGRVLDPDHPCKTPNLDRLASRGVRFTRAYTPNAVCSPARASLMTGLLPHNHGVVSVTHTVDNDQGCLRTDKPHWAQELVKSGYRTGYFGKWHVERSFDLRKYGWQVNGCEGSKVYKDTVAEIRSKYPDEDYGLAYYLENPGYKRQIFYGVTNVPPEKREMGGRIDLGLSFLDQVLPNAEPWCCFVSLNEPHDPFICGKDAYAQYDVDSIELASNVHDELEGRPGIYRKASLVWKDMTDRQRREAAVCYYASITEIDQQFGRLIDKVEQAGQLENTIIIVTTDHGELLGAHGLYCKNFSGAEEIYNIPLLISGPDIEENVTCTSRVGLHDVCPTLLELTGCTSFDIPDSRSFASVLKGDNDGSRFTYGFAEYYGTRVLLSQRVVWDDQWKFVFNGFDFDELYNLDDDPYEMNNLAQDRQYDHIVKRMCELMWKTIRETGDRSLYNTHYPILRVAPYGPMAE